MIDTQTAQFLNGSSGDSNAVSLYRRFALTGPRTTVYTAQDQRFYVGVPPKYTSYSGLTSSSTSSAVNYRRDNNTFIVNGSGLGVISTVEIVDINGNAIPGVTDATDTTGISSVTPSSFSLDTNASAFTGKGHLLDSATYLSNNNGTRRLQIVTPFGLQLARPLKHSQFQPRQIICPSVRIIRQPIHSRGRLISTGAITMPQGDYW